MRRHPPIVPGDRFGRLVVTSVYRNSNRKERCNCLCDCGNEHDASPSSLRSGAVRSCRCLQRELAATSHTTHGMFGTRLYGIWVSMHKRCRGTSTAQHRRLYRDRGIVVCAEWATFEPFMSWAAANGYSDDLSIDRVDPNGNYTPSNCRWVSMKVQANNKRNNHLLTLHGTTKTLRQWSEEYGLKWTALHERLRRGWSVEDAITKPLMRKPS